MGLTRPQCELIQPVDWLAAQISDPVLRLRFLKQTVRPAMGLQNRIKRCLVPAAIMLLVFVGVLGWRVRDSRRAARAPAPQTATPAGPRVRVIVPQGRVAPAASVWAVEKAEESETYSNGLRLDNRYRIANRPRSYVAFPVARPGYIGGERRSKPAGIVFHTTESRLAPFEAQQNQLLRRIGESLLEFVRRRRAYNFVIDRFGRVYRIVPEGEAANHAGYSVWADGQWVYLNLNDSFLGVSFEAQTERGQSEAVVNPAQVRSAAMLAEMLRDRYGIAAANCVTHAQVSVNPSNMRVGYHTDWASSFPFAALGLPDNYGRAIPALWFFGFEADRSFAASTGSLMQAGVARAESALVSQAANARTPVAAYRKTLQRRYRDYLAAVRRGDAVTTEAVE